jgi:hypothetical protein
MKLNPYLFSASAILILVSLNIHNIRAFYWKVEHATVQLKNCAANCELKGTLSVIPFDGRYKLTTETREIVFSKNDIKLISVPIQNSKAS